MCLLQWLLVLTEQYPGSPWIGRDASRTLTLTLTPLWRANGASAAITCHDWCCCTSYFFVLFYYNIIHTYVATIIRGRLREILVAKTLQKTTSVFFFLFKAGLIDCCMQMQQASWKYFSGELVDLEARSLTNCNSIFISPSSSFLFLPSSSFPCFPSFSFHFLSLPLFVPFFHHFPFSSSFFFLLLQSRFFSSCVV